MTAASLLHKKQILPIGLDEAWAFFSDPGNLPFITPPDMGFTVLSAPPPDIHPGLILRYSVRPLPGFRTTWVSEITEVRAPDFFVDEQRQGPYRLWRHEHRFSAVPGGVLVEDLVRYRLPFGFLGAIFAGALVRRKLDGIFSFRSRVLAARFPAQAATPSGNRTVTPGGSGRIPMKGPQE
ncbi:MAG: cell division inhibitor [Fibrobacteres bacterium]|nr:cell division inhibitor [Fibrobacterota bacterium]